MLPRDTKENEQSFDRQSNESTTNEAPPVAPSIADGTKRLFADKTASEINTSHCPIPNEGSGSTHKKMKASCITAQSQYDSSTAQITMSLSEYEGLRSSAAHWHSQWSDERARVEHMSSVHTELGGLLVQSSLLLQRGCAVLRGQGELAMDLSQKMQRGERIGEDTVTEVWLAATELLHEADEHASMVRSWQLMDRTAERSEPRAREAWAPEPESQRPSEQHALAKGAGEAAWQLGSLQQPAREDAQEPGLADQSRVAWSQIMHDGGDGSE